MNGESFVKVKCPCGSVNYVYTGYFPCTDNSALDVDGFTCWSCTQEVPFLSLEELRDMGLDDDFMLRIEDGQKELL